MIDFSVSTGPVDSLAPLGARRSANTMATKIGSPLKTYNLIFSNNSLNHDDVTKWKHFPRHWPFVREIHPVNFPHKGQWRGALLFALICAWINGWVNNREAGDLRCYRAHYDVIVINNFRQDSIVGASAETENGLFCLERYINLLIVSPSGTKGYFMNKEYTHWTSLMAQILG